MAVVTSTNDFDFNQEYAAIDKFSKLVFNKLIRKTLKSDGKQAKIDTDIVFSEHAMVPPGYALFEFVQRRVDK